MFTAGGELILRMIILDGAKNSYSADSSGGIVYVPANGKLSIQSGATLQNSRTEQMGGAVYVAQDGTADMSNGAVVNNISADDGAGIYLEPGSSLRLSGDPDFGGTGTDAFGNITYNSGNFKEGELIAKTNGGKDYRMARQEIFIAGYGGETAVSLAVNAAISSDDGTIWIWAEKDLHYRQNLQFATSTTSDPGNMKAFRNAQDDSSAENTTGDYLYGIAGEDGYIYWSGITGSRRVILRKVGQGYESLQGAKFTIHMNTPTGPAVKVDDVTLENLESGSAGAFWVGALPYGTYYIEETQPPQGYTDPQGKTYKLVVNEDGCFTDEDSTKTAKELSLS